MNENTKKKILSEESGKPSIPAPRTQHAQQQEDLDKVWAEEIAQLKSKTFYSLDQALEAVIDAVLTRMKVEGPERADTKMALSEMFKDNRIIRESIKQNLTIKP